MGHRAGVLRGGETEKRRSGETRRMIPDDGRPRTDDGGRRLAPVESPAGCAKAQFNGVKTTLGLNIDD
jgi:hypothetical protein